MPIAKIITLPIITVKGNLRKNICYLKDLSSFSRISTFFHRAHFEREHLCKNFASKPREIGARLWRESRRN
ncbi:MAG: hypothetical protein AMS15_00905 [Planctomycetes bacterium DG_23]|nr:MAG: hypothetical protein AMS15_00905 [Planctomycetes bacterium DG_23]